MCIYICIYGGGDAGSRELPDDVRELMGCTDGYDGYIRYFRAKFPRVVLEMYLWAIDTGLNKQESAFLPYFLPS